MKTSKIYIVGTLIAATLFAGGCATSADKRVDAQVSKQGAIQTNQDLRAETKNVIEETPGLTTDQRAKLTSLRIQTQSEMSALNNESLQLRGALVENVFSKHERRAEIKTIQSRLKKIEDKKLDLTFKAVDKAYTILGKQAVDNQRLMNEMIDGRRVF